MKPNDDNAKLPADPRPFRILIISGSNRRQYNCPGADSKSGMLMLQMAANLPQEWEIDYEDMGNVYKIEHIQSCNACVSTSMVSKYRIIYGNMNCLIRIKNIVMSSLKIW